MLMIKANFPLQKVMADTKKNNAQIIVRPIRQYYIHWKSKKESKTVMNFYLGAMKVEYNYYKSLD